MRGANVTIPHKGGVVPLVDWLDADARTAEAVNTIVLDGGRLRGYNTDIAGVREAVLDAAGEPLAGSAALVFGAGGAARAAAVALARLGMDLTIVNRTAARAAAPRGACGDGRARRALPAAGPRRRDAGGHGRAPAHRQRDLTRHGGRK